MDVRGSVIMNEVVSSFAIPVLVDLFLSTIYLPCCNISLSLVDHW
jgi:hypothetical protein